MSLTELFEACREGNVASVRKAVENGLNVKDAVDKEFLNLTPLHYACWYDLCIELFWHTAFICIVANIVTFRPGVATRHRTYLCRVRLSSLFGHDGYFSLVVIEISYNF